MNDRPERVRRILVHDFSGHPFQVHLSRELARRGNEVLHVYCSSYTTGRGRVESTANDPVTLSIRAVSLDDEFSKYSPAKRLLQETMYSKRFVGVVDSFRPDLVIESNDPLLAKTLTARHLRRAGVPWIFWLQDLYSVAIAGEMAERLGSLGRLAGRLPLAIEGRVLRGASAVVPITADYDGHLDKWRVPRARRKVIHNWAPVDEIVALPPSKAWARERGVDNHRIVLYAGTLGLKHDPDLLLRLARSVADRAVSVVVVSEGYGADYLRSEAEGQPNLHVLPFQPYEELSEMFAAADVLLTILSGSAGVFSVPSKLLTYLCAGRAVLAAIPHVNLAARLLKDSGGGLVADPRDPVAVAAALENLLDDDQERSAMGARGRHYAEEHFDIRAIADQFLDVISSSV